MPHGACHTVLAAFNDQPLRLTGSGKTSDDVDLEGTYYNTNAQVEALETLLRKLPDPAHWHESANTWASTTSPC
jgi:hypothetical protein